ncbi:MAG: flotillin domain-containing protein [Pseudomonadota bacterium]
MAQLQEIAIIVLLVFLVIAAIAFVITRLYQRASKEVSFVRTGFRGQRVVMNGGAIVLPVLHETIPVNMNTLRLEVARANDAALITHDRMRVDVTAEFYVRVKPTQESIANAAQTLGMKTMNPVELKSLVEGKFVDALRAVAAEMAMEELHEKRVDFVQKVQQVVSEDLLKNGLELESVSLTGLDQTSFEHFNPQNAFDAEGMTKLTAAIESRRKKRNDIEQDTAVAIQLKNLEAEREKLEIGKEEEYARLAQEREVEVRRASQVSEIASERAAKDRAAKEAEIAAKQQVDLAAIIAKREVDEKRIVMEREIRETEIQKARTVETAEIERQKTVELTEQDRAIAIAEKSRAQSEAQAEADRARAEAVREEEQVITVRETTRAERAREIELVAARQEAGKQAIELTVAAEAEKQAAEDKAQAVRTLAEAEADRVKIAADGAAEATMRDAAAQAKRYEVDATGKRAVNEAANVLSQEQIAMQIKLALMEHLPAIIAESVKPMEAIDGIRIMQVEGLNPSGASGNGGNAAESAPAGGGSLADQVVNSALRYRAQSPLVDSLLGEIGLEGGDINGLTNALETPKSNGAGFVDSETHS